MNLLSVKNISTKLIQCSLATILLMLGACSEPAQQSSVEFTPYYQRVALGCGSEFLVGGNPWHYKDFEFFISKVELQNQQGEWLSWPMRQSQYQTSNIALVGQKCPDTFTKGLTKTLTESIPAPVSEQKQQTTTQTGNWKIQFDPKFELDGMHKLRFTLGLPFELNHAYPLSQPSPLNLPSMFWVWRTGHKFLRLELQSSNDNWIFHLGSSGCSSASAVRGPKTACLRPNRIQVELPFSVDPSTHNAKKLVFDVASLLGSLSPKLESSCQSEPDNPACRVLMSNLKQQPSSVFSWSL